MSLTSIPRFGKSSMATETTSSLPDAHFCKASLWAPNVVVRRTSVMRQWTMDRQSTGSFFVSRICSAEVSEVWRLEKSLELRRRTYGDQSSNALLHLR